MKDIKAIFFDFDDTLGNREVYAYNCYRAILKENTDIDDPVLFETIVQDCMLWDEKGNVNKKYVKDMLKKAWNIELPFDDFNTYWDSRLWEFAELLPDARETLEELKKKYKIGIITNGPAEGQRKKLQTAGIWDLFDEDLIIVSGDWPFAKPDVRLFHKACERAGVLPEEAVHVGDLFSRDVIGAYNAGMTPVWIWTQGVRKNETDVITIHFLKELLRLF